MSIFSSSSRDTFGLLCSQDPYASCMRFFDIRGVHIEQLGKKTINQLINKEYIRKPIDIFGLNAGKLTGLDRFGSTQAKIVIDAISEGRETSLKRFIFACGIYGIEENSSHNLAEHFGSISAIMDASIWDLERMLPEASAVNLYNFFTHHKNKTAIKDLLCEFNITYTT